MTAFNPYQIDATGGPVTNPAKPNPATRRFGTAHWVSFVILWVGCLILNATFVERELDAGSEKSLKVILTPLCTLGGPMLGAWVRDASHGCCYELSMSLLLFVTPLVVAAIAVQFAWRPQHLTLRFLRLLMWCTAWIIWFGAGILSVGHALS